MVGVESFLGESAESVNGIENLGNRVSEKKSVGQALSISVCSVLSPERVTAAKDGSSNSDADVTRECRDSSVSCLIPNRNVHLVGQTYVLLDQIKTQVELRLWKIQTMQMVLQLLFGRRETIGQRTRHRKF